MHLGTCRVASRQTNLGCRTSSRVWAPYPAWCGSLRYQHQPDGWPQCRVPAVAVQVFDKFKGWFGGQKPSEDDNAEAGTMKRLSPDSTKGVDGGDDAFGPATVLLVAFTREEVEVFRQMMLEMEADFYKISHCTPAMLDMTLQQALEVDCPMWEQAPLGLRRAVILSGMLTWEVVELVSAYKETGLPTAIFAVAVPNNMNRHLRGLLQEVAAEDVVMKRMAAERAAQRQQQQQQQQ